MGRELRGRRGREDAARGGPAWGESGGRPPLGRGGVSGGAEDAPSREAGARLTPRRRSRSPRLGPAGLGLGGSGTRAARRVLRPARRAARRGQGQGVGHGATRGLGRGRPACTRGARVCLSGRTHGRTWTGRQTGVVGAREAGLGGADGQRAAASCQLSPWSAGVGGLRQGRPAGGLLPCPRAPSARSLPHSPPGCPGPWCCSCSVNSDVTARSRGRGRGDPGRPFLHRPPQPCRGRAPGSPGAAGPANGPLKASLSSGSGTVAFHGPHPGFRDCHPQSWPSARIFRSVSSGEAGRGCQAPPRLRLEGG